MHTYRLGFNGERPDAVSGVYLLGNGYRAYCPTLMRFTGPDNLSPFGAGGISPYAYCSADPVNHADPSGHLSWQGWSGIGMGLVGLGLTIITAGAAIAATGGIVAAIESASGFSLLTGVAGVVSDITAIASGATEQSYPSASVILGWLALASGALGLAHGIYTAAIGGVRSLNKLTESSRQRLGNIYHSGLSGGAEQAGREMAAANRPFLAGFSAGAQLNAQGLVEEAVSWPVYRVTRGNRRPLDILRKGFPPSKRFFAVKNMLSAQQDSLIVSDTYQGAMNFFNDVEGQYIFRINPAENSRGVSYVKNMLFNTERLEQFRAPMYHEDPGQGIWNAMVNDYHRDAIKYAETHLSLSQPLDNSNISLVFSRNARRFSI